MDLSWNQLKTIDFDLFLPQYTQLESLYLNENELTELEGLTHTLFPTLKVLGITGNNFNCSYLRKFLRKNTWQKLTFVDDYWAPLNPHETNIYGVNCETVNDDDEIKSTVIMIDVSGKTMETFKYDSPINYKEIFFIFSQQRNNLHMMKWLLILLCLMILLLLVIVLIVLFINRDRILHIRVYRGISTKSDSHSRACLKSDFEVSTFCHESNYAS